MQGVTFDFKFPTKKDSIEFSDIPDNTTFMGYFGGGAQVPVLYLKSVGNNFFNFQTGHCGFSTGDQLVYAYRPVKVTIVVEDIKEK